MNRLRRLLLSREERDYLRAFDKAEPVEGTGRPTVRVDGENVSTACSVTFDGRMDEAGLLRITERVRDDLARRERTASGLVRN